MRNDDDRTAPTFTPTRAATSFGDTGNLPTVDPGRAFPPKAPSLPAALKREAAERKEQLEVSEASERRSMFCGLLILALMALLFSLIRAGVGRAFPAGLWR